MHLGCLGFLHHSFMKPVHHKRYISFPDNPRQIYTVISQSERINIYSFTGIVAQDGYLIWRPIKSSRLLLDACALKVFKICAAFLLTKNHIHSIYSILSMTLFRDPQSNKTLKTPAEGVLPTPSHTVAVPVPCGGGGDGDLLMAKEVIILVLF